MFSKYCEDPLGTSSTQIGVIGAMIFPPPAVAFQVNITVQVKLLMQLLEMYLKLRKVRYYFEFILKFVCVSVCDMNVCVCCCVCMCVSVYVYKCVCV